MNKRIALLSGIALSAMSLASVSAADKTTYSLQFDATKYTVKTLTVGGTTIKYRAFENIVYVANPVDPAYEIMNIYVPEDYYAGKSVGGYTSTTAPIFFPNGIGGYMPSLPSTPDKNGPAGMPAGFAPGGTGAQGGQAAAASGGPAPLSGPDLLAAGAKGGDGDHGPGGPGGFAGPSGPSAIFVALSKGYVVASPGTRGRTSQGADGLYTGKAPACIVDLKAAVRYLRYNDKVIPGNAERIVSNGTSAGGAASALLGATGNNKDYDPYLKAIGAADARDDVWATSAYCPITNLDNADAAYEWQFNDINDFNAMGGKGTLSAEQIAVSAQLKAQFTTYLNALGLKKADGTALTLDAGGNGTFKDYIKSLIVASAQKALAAGKTIPVESGVTVKDGKATDVNFEKYIAYIGRMKSTPAFDSFDASAAENSLFGTATAAVQHFTQISMDHASVKTTLADPAIVKLMNPMNYIGTSGTTVSKFWRIRHGASDRDASFPIATMLATKLQNSGSVVDFALPWGQGHGGDYDLDELFTWIASVVR